MCKPFKGNGELLDLADGTPVDLYLLFFFPSILKVQIIAH